MTDDLSQMVHAVFGYGLGLKQRLDRGESPALDAEQAAIRRLLFARPEADRWPAFAGDAVDPAGPERPGPPFLGLRYALTCWLDELFILYTRWDAAWTERKLEMTLYGTNDRAWRFWEQADAAGRRSDQAVLGVFLVCVALGFRGDYRDDPARLAAWLTETQDRVCRTPAGGWQPPPHLPPPTDAPPLKGREALNRMALTAGWVLLATLPVVAFLAVRQLAG